MGHGQGDSSERNGQGDSHSGTGIDNEISGGHFAGPVGQFGYVHGDVNLNPPRSPEEAAFRARYMAKMQEAWDAEERAKTEGPGGCAIAMLIFAIVFFVFWVIWMIDIVSKTGLMP
ncbi:hypothetical protein MOQ72_42610 [Saccharopolyspora sp. K220]|uniref:hypothetical protein n=1 Tax=Saccharopolyspora soli TaxID=2926618 RepID=UPI001F57170C|nr:hypothetical protein [Saccharopolyspora soli]MCI2424109.1 hypothetical protein [Saccharopolyspora soli]